jgi:hypothetical protein
MVAESILVKAGVKLIRRRIDRRRIVDLAAICGLGGKLIGKLAANRRQIDQQIGGKLAAN